MHDVRVRPECAQERDGGLDAGGRDREEAPHGDRSRSTTAPTPSNSSATPAVTSASAGP